MEAKLTQEQQREMTLKKVQDAIDELKKDDYPLTITNICYISKLSRATMYKKHVQALLQENGIQIVPRNKSLGTLKK